jgi:hypothetical protein
MIILRYRQRISHDTPFVRRVVDEFTVYNETREPEESLTFEADLYRPGLRVFDSDDGELGFLPNEMVKRSYRSHADSSKPGFDPEAKRRLDAMQAHPPRSFFLVVSLPPERKLNPGEARVIRCEWTDPEEPETARVGLFSIPEYYISAKVEGGAGFIRHASISAPEGFRLVASPVGMFRLDGDELGDPVDPPEHFHSDIDGPVMHDYSIPSHPFDACFLAFYSIYPETSEYWLFAGFFLAYLVLAGGTLAAYLGFFVWAHIPLPSLEILKGYASLIGTGLLAVGVGFLGFVTNPLTHRTKLWTLIPVGFSIVVILLGPAPHF